MMYTPSGYKAYLYPYFQRYINQKKQMEPDAQSDKKQLIDPSIFLFN